MLYSGFKLIAGLAQKNVQSPFAQANIFILELNYRNIIGHIGAYSQRPNDEISR